MANDFFNHSGYPATRAQGDSSSMRAQLAAIAAGFDKMPALTGNALRLLRVNAGATALEAINAIDGIPIGGATPAAGAFTTLSSSGLATLASATVTGAFAANGGVTLGDAAGDALTINPSAVTWANNPTHSGNHTFSGAVAFSGNVTLGSGIEDSISVLADTITVTPELTISADNNIILTGAGAFTVEKASTQFTGAVAVGGAFSAATGTFSSNTLPQVLVDRPGAATNALTNYRTTAGSIYVGHGATNTWAIGSTTDLSSSPWFEVTSQLTLARGALLTNASTFGGLGYTIGAGGQVVQTTSKSTAVTLNAWCGAITTTASALAGGARVSFTVNNSNVTSNDVPIVSLRSGGTVDSYVVSVTAVAAGSFRVQIANLTGGSLSEALVINFGIMRAALS